VKHSLIGFAVVAAALTGCGTTVPLAQQSSFGTQSLGTQPVGAPDGTSSEPVPGAASVPGTAVAPPAGGTGTTSSTTGSVPDAVRTGVGGVAPSGGSVEVGFLVAKDIGPATKALGVDGLSTGNGANQARAAVALLNSRGGLNGKTVKPVILEQDATQNADTQYQQACGLFFDDHKVVAVVGWGLLPVVQSCAMQHHVPYVTSGNRTTSSAELSRYPYLVVPSQLDLRRLVASLVPSLAAQGYFTARTATEVVKIGLIYNEDTDFSQVPQLVSAELRSLGLTLADKQSMPGVDDTSQVGAASNAGASAVLRFSSEGITHVISIDKSGQALAYFALAAQNQAYYPQFGLSSLELPSSLRTVLQARQLQGARGIGWMPSWDVPVTAQPPLSANARACVSALSKAGEDMTLAATRGSAIATCDGALLLGAAWKGQALTPDGFLSGLRALGEGYPPAVTLADDFRTRRDGVSQVRPLAYQGKCDCFAYTGPLTKAAS